MSLRPDRRLQLRIAGALALVVVVNAVTLSVLAWGVQRGLSASDHAIRLDHGVPFTVGAVLLGAIGLVALQARYGSRTAVSGLEIEETEGDGPRNVAAQARRLVTQADVPAPTVAVADRPEPNCLTVGSQRSPTIVVTTGLLAELDDDELEAALAHEIVHLANRDLTVVSAVTAIVAIGDRLLERERTLREGLVMLVGFVGITLGSVRVTVHLAPFGLLLLFLLVVPFVVITALFLVVSPVARLLLGVNAIALGLFATAREYAADRGASRLTGDPAAVASALESLEGDARPDRDARLDAIATLGIVSQSLSIDRPDDEESWFERWFVSQFRTWRENVSESEFDPDTSDSSEEGFDPQWPPDRDGERKSWIVEPFVKPAVAPIWERVRWVLTCRPPTHPSTEARIEQLRTLERQRRK